MKKKKEAQQQVALTPLPTSKNQPPVRGEQKMTIYEYEDKYVHRQNTRGIKFFARFLTAVVGIFLLFCILSLVMQAFDINLYVGIGGAVVGALVFIFAFIVPVVKIYKTDFFVTNVNSKSARQAQKHNAELRRKIADKFIEFNATVDGVGWYDDRLVGELAIAVHRDDNEKIKTTLTALYGKSVKKTGREIITKAAFKAGFYSAVSQTNVVDAALVAVVNIQLVKDIVFLYGFRPSDARLVHIFGKVIRNSLTAYGLGSAKIGNAVIKTFGDALKGIPLLGTVISTLVDSSVQGMTNAVLTALIGYQTIRYLNREYKLQDILDGIELENEGEFEETCEEVETELKKCGKRPSQKVSA